MSEIAEVILSMGRHHLKIAGFVLATEGDKCRYVAERINAAAAEEEE